MLVRGRQAGGGSCGITQNTKNRNTKPKSNSQRLKIQSVVTVTGAREKSATTLFRKLLQPRKKK